MSNNEIKQKKGDSDTNVVVRLLRNVAVGIRAPGPAAILICWMLCVTALGLFGDGTYTGSALTFLVFFAGLILASVAGKL